MGAFTMYGLSTVQYIILSVVIYRRLMKSRFIPEIPYNLTAVFYFRTVFYESMALITETVVCVVS